VDEKVLTRTRSTTREDVLYYDSQSAILLNKNSTFHSRLKHIDVKCHWICDALENKLLQIEKKHIDENG
jgi:hypothetical protein